MLELHTHAEKRVKRENQATSYQLVILLLETSWHRDHFFDGNKQRIWISTHLQQRGEKMPHNWTGDCVAHQIIISNVVWFIKKKRKRKKKQVIFSYPRDWISSIFVCWKYALCQNYTSIVNLFRVALTKVILANEKWKVSKKSRLRKIRKFKRVSLLIFQLKKKYLEITQKSFLNKSKQNSTNYWKSI